MLLLVCLVSQNVHVIFFIFLILSVIFSISLSYDHTKLSCSNITVNYAYNCHQMYNYVCIISLYNSIKIENIWQNKRERIVIWHSRFRRHFGELTLPAQQPRINPGYRSYFCFPLSGMACKLQVKFLLSFNELPSHEFTPWDTLRALGYLLRLLEVKGRCDLFPCQPVTKTTWSTYSICNY